MCLKRIFKNSFLFNFFHIKIKKEMTKIVRFKCCKSIQSGSEIVDIGPDPDLTDIYPNYDDQNSKKQW